MATAVAGACVATDDAPIEVTPGQADDDLGKADQSSGPRAELKLTVDASDIRRARSRLRLLNAASETRRIWFYDTPTLALFDAGAILRAREIDGDDDDSTIKLRPFEAADVDPAWLDLDGFKCELDRSLEGETPSCSFTVAQDDGEIVDVGDGARTIDKLFSGEQEAFLAEHGHDVAWDELSPLGPIFARVWTIRTSALPEKVTAELWYMPDATQVLELSMKVPAGDADDGLDTLADWVDDRGLDLSTQQGSKTRRALEVLAAP